MDSTEEKEILRLLKELKASPAMNGAFEGLLLSVNEIKSTQGKMCTDLNNVIIRQKQAGKKLDKMSEALYHPDRGIYKRINDTISSDDDHEEDIDALETKAETLEKQVYKHGAKIRELEIARGDLKKVAGERLENLDSAVQMNNNWRKLFWALGIGGAGLLLKEIVPFIIALL
jgi:hypothetical protein